MRPVSARKRSRTRDGKRDRFVGAVGVGSLFVVALPQPAIAATLDRIQSAVTFGAIALAIAAILWALSASAAQRSLSRKFRALSSKAAAAVAARDAIIGAGREAVLVRGTDSEDSHKYGDADKLLESCLAGPNATELSRALDALSGTGQAFQLSAHDKDGAPIRVRGRAVGGFAALWLEKEPVPSAEGLDFRAIADALPVPVWIRDPALSLVWVNRAFAAAVGSRDPQSVLTGQVALERSERDLAGAARTEGRPVEAKRFAVVAGQRRAMLIKNQPLPDGRVAGIALDMSDVSSAEAKLQQHLDAHADTLDKLATAVAIFGRDQRLSFYNRAFAQLWSLPDAWLDTHPGDGEILDRLRELRRLPEQRDYQSWKRNRMALYDQADTYPQEELWHLPGGKTLRVVAQPHPFGGLTYLYEDVTEKVALESNYNTLIKVQRATLDSLGEGVAVFGPDGRLKLHNAALVRLWQFEPTELAGEPHVQRISQACVERFGQESAWEDLVASVTSGSERRYGWGEIERLDGVIVSVSLAPLPDGATLVTFADVTDRFRIESALRERNEALEAADRLKSEFVHHASFLFRDPLNAVHGFADMLAAGHAGALNQRQSEYVQNILSASSKLAEITSDILDLAMIDSGTMQLELGRVDLHELLARVAEPLRQHAESLDIKFVLEVQSGIGTVLVDQKRLRQVVFNLLSNAFRYTPRGGRIVLGAQIVDDDTQVYVSDNGPGIAPEVKASVFERFAAKGRAGLQAGAGLGLALVNRFVELHGGWVEIESREGQGTLVRCHLPRRPSEITDAHKRDSHAA